MVTAMGYRNQGFTYVGLLFAIVLLGVLLSAAGVVWHTAMKREKEKELLFVGAQYQEALRSYHAVLVNGKAAYPRSLEELVEDRRFPMPVRHLRKRYVDPVTNSPDWGLVRSGGGIAGVYSLSGEAPLKRADFGSCCDGFEKARNYAEWKFAIPVEAAAAPAPAKKSIVQTDRR
jgi:type II secretory pathway pseudopilin PulG